MTIDTLVVVMVFVFVPSFAAGAARRSIVNSSGRVPYVTDSRRPLVNGPPGPREAVKHAFGAFVVVGRMNGLLMP